MEELTPRERVLTALRRSVPDRVHWIENEIEEELQVKIMRTTEYAPADLCWTLGASGFGNRFPKRGDSGREPGAPDLDQN